MLDIYKILKNTTVEGPGSRFCIWAQGCSKHCRGCWAKETWSFGVGKKFTVEELFSLILQEKNNIEGVTFLGGEPFEQARDFSLLAEKIKQVGLSVVCFTGLNFEDLKNKNDLDINSFLNNIDLLIDGGFEIENFDLSRPWVGSSNQRYIFLSNFYNLDEILAYKNKVEVRIDENGKVDVNGMADFEKIKTSLTLQLGKNSL